MHSPRLQSGKRYVARFLAIVCLWLSGVAVLAHTDDLRAFGALHTSRTHLITHAAGSKGPDRCAACEWIQAAGPLQTASVVVANLPVLLSSQSESGPSALHLASFLDILLRGPPRLSA